MIMNNLKKIDFQFYLLAFLPIAFVIGPLIVESIINILIIFFIYNIFKKKNFSYIKNKIFISLLIFYFIILISQFNSSYFNETKINVFFYIRFIIFPFAVYEILKKDKKYLRYIFLALLMTIFIVSLDGYIQFFFEKNIFGYEKYRPDRISGFFKDDLILGSYLSRLLPLIICTAIYFKNEKKLNKISILIVALCTMLIFLSGERAAFIKTLIGLIIVFFIINIRWKIKTLLLIFFTFCILVIIFTNQLMFDRYVNQMKLHLFKNNDGDKFMLMSNHYPMFETSIKMFNDSKIIGKGPKSYRYHCNNPDFITYYKDKNQTVDNTILKITLPWKKLGEIELKEIFIAENDLIKKGDKIFSYNFFGKNKKYTYLSKREGIVEKIFKKKENIYSRNHVFLKLDPQNSPDKEILKTSACNTHPHNFYFQLLAETGILGFIYVLSLFLFISYLLIKNFIFYLKKSPKKISDTELCLLVGFFLALWPLTTNGNFFNNWINLMNFYPLGFYLFLRNKRING